MGVALTPEGKDLIARLQAEGSPLIIDKFYFALVDWPEEAAPPVTNTLTNIVHIADVPPEYRAFVSPSRVVYSAFLGSDVGDFAFNCQGLYCSEHATLLAVATFPLLRKKKFDEGTNTPGNNWTRNFMLEFSGAQAVTQITVEAAVWQLDFTVRLKGIDERERLSNYDVYGQAAFIGDAWLITGASGVYSFASGVGYVGGVRAALYDAMTVPVENYPCDVWLDVSMPREGSDVITEATPLFLAESTWPGEYHTYTDGAPFNLPHYCAKIAHIDEYGNVTDLRKKYAVLPEEGEDGAVLMRQGGLWVVRKPCPYRVGQYYFWQDEDPEEGMFPLLAGWVENFDRYAEAVKYFNSPAGQARLVTLAEYEAMHIDTWHTNADGTTVGWNGIGGVNRFVWDKLNNRMKVPDLAGMSPEQIGCDSLGVAGVHGDAIRDFTGYVEAQWGALTGSGVFAPDGTGIRRSDQSGMVNAGQLRARFAPSLVVPVANKNQIRSYGVNGCVWFGLAS